MLVAWDPLLIVECASQRITELNPAACMLYGFSREELIGSSFGERFSESRHAQDIFTQHRDYVPLRFHRGRGERHIPVEMAIRYFQDGDREYAAIGLREISERLERERIDHESERKYQSLFEASPYPILIINLHGMIVDANRCAQLHYGYTQEELIRMEWGVLDLTGGQLQFMPRPTMLGAREHRRSDGSSFMAEVMLSYFRLRGQSLILALVRDVTEHWRTFHQLQESEARWRFAIEGHGDALIDWALESDGTHYVSPALSTMLGYSPEDDIGLNGDAWMARVHQDDREHMANAINAHQAGHDPIVQVEYRLRTRNGDYRWMALRAKVIQIDNRRLGRLIGAVRDIHDQRLRQLQEVADRGRIFRLERMATAGEMLSALAHEVNQPLTAISNYSALAIRQFASAVDEKSISKSLKVISEQALRAGEIVRRIREFVRRSEPSFQPANPNTLIRRVAGWCENEAVAAGIQIQLELDLGMINFELDILQIEQVLFNLLRNGLEAMHDDRLSRPRRLIVASHRTPNEVRISVRDFGEGLDEHTAASNMFDPFVSSKPEGMGMGLAICRTVIESHGGHIWAETPKEGRGTVFTFTLDPSRGGNLAGGDQ
jgi:two-component system, LuxR family, sensor kinase FixL